MLESRLSPPPSVIYSFSYEHGRSKLILYTILLSSARARAASISNVHRSSISAPREKNNREFSRISPQMFSGRGPCRSCKFISDITKRRDGVKRVSCETRALARGENNENKYVPRVQRVAGRSFRRSGYVRTRRD